MQRDKEEQMKSGFRFRVLFLCSLFLISCSGESAKSTQELLSQEINGNGTTATFFSLDAMETTDDAFGSQKLSVADGQPCWRRKVDLSDSVKTIEILSETDTEVNVKVTVFVSGDLALSLDCFFDPLDPTSYGNKPFSVTATRFGKFSKNPLGLVAVSPLEFDLTESTKQTVNIIQTDLIEGNGTVHTISDPAIPTEVSALASFTEGDQVTIEVTLGNKNADDTPRATRVFLHSPDMRGKLLMVQGLDGAFTSTITIPSAGFHHLAVDALDEAVFVDETTDNYNGNGWLIPFQVVPSLLVSHIHSSVRMSLFRTKETDGLFSLL